MAAPPLREYLDFAVQTAWEAGRLTLGYFRTEIETETKADASPVTIADRRAEECIRRRIEARFPGHRIVGEEYGEREAETGAPCWWVDPIDGTRSFVRGVPLYGVLLGLEVEGRIVVGAAYFPALDEMLCAAEGQGCYLNGRRCRVSPAASLSSGTVCYTNAVAFACAGREEAFRRILSRAAYSAGWSDAYGHALVASGRAELMLDPVMKPYDCGPFPVILREAGGFFGDWAGRETLFGGEALSTSRALLPEVLAVLHGEPPPKGDPS
ncbi:MAG: inositol monophosphatase family protein [Desulfobacterales bacterium]